MNIKFSYSVAIRTLGTAGEKYIKLLNSIRAQTIQPEKIVVVLPKGYALPDYRLGYEEFVFSEKGMITQRLFAVDYISSEYILFCDDDVELKSNFVEKLSDAFLCYKYDCASGPLLSFFPPKGIKYFLASLLGGACFMLHGRKTQYVRLLKTTGWSYNYSIDIENHRVYNTDSLAWTCFCIKKSALVMIRFEDELWAEKHPYCAFDDQLFFSKLIINGFKICIVSDAEYLHNDGKTSVADMKFEPIYSFSFNRYVYWHRYIYSMANNVVQRVWARICNGHYMTMSVIYQFIKIIAKRSDIRIIKVKKRAYTDAKEFIKSEEYKCLPNPVVR